MFAQWGHMKFSANLGFLWTDLGLAEAIRAAAAAGFDAVECHWPYDEPLIDIQRALSETGLPMLGLNTRRGDISLGENGLCALPDRIQDARDSIDEAVDFGRALNAKNIHVMAGITQSKEAHATFVQALEYATDQAAKCDMTILIEPLNTFDTPGYFLCTTNQALAIIDQVAAPNLKLMFDCYHIERMEGNVTARLRDTWPYIGHIQFADTPHRSAPFTGDMEYSTIFQTISELGWEQPLGAEYRPNGPTQESLGWLKQVPS